MSKLLKHALGTIEDATGSIESLEITIETMRDLGETTLESKDMTLSIESLQSSIDQLNELKVSKDYSFESIRHIVSSVVPVDTLYSLESDHRMTEDLYLEVSLESLNTMMNKVKGWFINNKAANDENSAWVKETSAHSKAAIKESKLLTKDIKEPVSEVPVFMARRLYMGDEFNIAKLTKALDSTTTYFTKAFEDYWKALLKMLDVYTKDIHKAANTLGENATPDDIFKEADIQRGLSDFIKQIDSTWDAKDKNSKKHVLPGNRYLTFMFSIDTNNYVGNDYNLARPVIYLSKDDKSAGARTIHTEVTPSDIKAILQTQEKFAKFMEDIEKEAKKYNDVAYSLIMDFDKKVSKLKTSPRNIKIIQSVTENIVHSLFGTFASSKWTPVKYMFNVNVALSRLLVETAKKAK